ncbi:hypothetical protein [Streptomyces avidinii]
MAPAHPAEGALRAPLYLQGPEGPEGPWDEAGERLEDTGRAVVCTTWGQWLTAVLLDPGLRPLLGEDWPRFRRTPSAAGRLRLAVSRYVMQYAAATALDVPVHTVELGRGQLFDSSWQLFCQEAWQHPLGTRSEIGGDTVEESPGTAPTCTENGTRAIRRVIAGNCPGERN